MASRDVLRRGMARITAFAQGLQETGWTLGRNPALVG